MPTGRVTASIDCWPKAQVTSAGLGCRLETGPRRLENAGPSSMPSLVHFDVQNHVSMAIERIEREVIRTAGTSFYQQGAMRGLSGPSSVPGAQRSSPTTRDSAVLGSTPPCACARCSTTPSAGIGSGSSVSASQLRASNGIHQRSEAFAPKRVVAEQVASRPVHCAKIAPRSAISRTFCSILVRGRRIGGTTRCLWKAPARFYLRLGGGVQVDLDCCALPQETWRRFRGKSKPNRGVDRDCQAGSDDPPHAGCPGETTITEERNGLHEVRMGDPALRNSFAGISGMFPATKC